MDKSKLILLIIGILLLVSISAYWIIRKEKSIKPFQCCDIDETLPQEGFFPRVNKCGNFDYNCDGIEERFCTVKTNITDYSGDCVRMDKLGYVISGWKKEIPNCGERATYISCYRFESSNCVGSELHRPTYAMGICGQRCDIDQVPAMPYATIVEQERTMLCR